MIIAILIPWGSLNVAAFIVAFLEKSSWEIANCLLVKIFFEIVIYQLDTLVHFVMIILWNIVITSANNIFCVAIYLLDRWMIISHENFVAHDWRTLYSNLLHHRKMKNPESALVLRSYCAIIFRLIILDLEQGDFIVFMSEIKQKQGMELIIIIVVVVAIMWDYFSCWVAINAYF